MGLVSGLDCAKSSRSALDEADADVRRQGPAVPLLSGGATIVAVPVT